MRVPATASATTGQAPAHSVLHSRSRTRAPGLLDTIAFAIPGGPPFVIEPQTDLPLITDPVVIDGATECIALVLPNCSGPVVEIRSPVAPFGVPTPGFFGLALRAGHTTIADLSIVGFFEDVSIQAIPATCDCGHNVLVNDYIGLEPDGNLPAVLGGVARPPSSGWGNTGVEIDSGDPGCVDCLSGNRILHNVISGVGQLGQGCAAHDRARLERQCRPGQPLRHEPGRDRCRRYCRDRQLCRSGSRSTPRAET